jgi:hypothetical protein
VLTPKQWVIMRAIEVSEDSETQPLDAGLLILVVPQKTPTRKAETEKMRSRRTGWSLGTNLHLVYEFSTILAAFSLFFPSFPL